MKNTLMIKMLLLAFLLSYGIASIAEPMVKDGILVGKNNMTLYVFDKDTENKSNCVQKCLENWPALIASDHEMKDYAVFLREDGIKQVSKLGDNYNNLWHVAKP